MISGIPRHLDPQDGYLRREVKQMKREASPPRGPGSLSDPMKGRESLVPTVKEPGRSIHLIPREELRQTCKDGIMAQVQEQLQLPQQDQLPQRVQVPQQDQVLQRVQVPQDNVQPL